MARRYEKWPFLSTSGERGASGLVRPVKARGRDLFPPYLSFVLLVIQQVKLRRPIDTASASYAKRSEAFLRRSVLDTSDGVRSNLGRQRK